MHGAPAVSFPVRRWQGPLCVAGALSVVSWVSLWCWQAVAPVPAVWLWGSAGLVLGGLAWALTDWWMSPNGTLLWDGQNWSFEPHGRGADFVVAPHQLAVALDLQSVMLLSLQRKPRWLWLKSGDDAAQWGDLRRALHMHSASRAANP